MYRLTIEVALGLIVAAGIAFAASTTFVSAAPSPDGPLAADALSFDVAAFCADHAAEPATETTREAASLTALCDVATSGQLPSYSQEVVNGLIFAQSQRTGPGLARHLGRLLDDEGRPDASQRAHTIAACRRLLQSDHADPDRDARCHALLDRDDRGDFDPAERCEGLLTSHEAVATHPRTAARCRYLLAHSNLDGFVDDVRTARPTHARDLSDRRADVRPPVDERAAGLPLARCEALTDGTDAEPRPALARHCAPSIDHDGDDDEPRRTPHRDSFLQRVSPLSLTPGGSQTAGQ